jgi:hypothetical protein
MPFEGRTPREASQRYRNSLNSLLTHTITRTPLILVVGERSGNITISFRREGQTSAAALSTRYGPVNLSLHQTLDAVEGQRERVRLRVIDYQYTITPLGADDPLFRWEFVRFPSSGSFWCRNHLQGPINISVGGQAVNLNDWHLPTGWVPIEEIIRFCIVDLGVPPLDPGSNADDIPTWHSRLKESETQSASSIVA